MKYKEVVISKKTIPSLPERLPVGTQIFTYNESKEGRWSHFTVGARRFLVEGTPRDHLYSWEWGRVKIRIPLDEIDSSNYWASQYCSTDELNTWIKDNNNSPSEPSKTPDEGEYSHPYSNEPTKYNNKHGRHNKDIKVGDYVVCKDGSFSLEVSNGKLLYASPAFERKVLKVLVTNGIFPAATGPLTKTANDLMCVYKDDPDKYLFINSRYVTKIRG